MSSTRDGTPRLDGRTAVDTGGTDGIGFETARRLAARGARVVVTGRDPSKGGRAAAALREAATGDGDASFLAADFASQADVRDLAARLDREVDRLDVFVSNAGAWFAVPGLTDDGVEETFAVNHLAPFVLVNLLSERLRETAAEAGEARVVVVSSELHRNARMAFRKLRSVHEVTGRDAYARSKLANVLFTFEAAERLRGTGVTANCLHPGAVLGTSLSREYGGAVRAAVSVLDTLPDSFTSRFAKSVAEGADTSVYLAASPEVEGVTGEYFADCAVERPSATARDERTRRRLWTVSADLTDLSPDEQIPPRSAGGAEWAAETGTETEVETGTEAGTGTSGGNRSQ